MTQLSLTAVVHNSEPRTSWGEIKYRDQKSCFCALHPCSCKLTVTHNPDVTKFQDTTRVLRMLAGKYRVYASSAIGDNECNIAFVVYYKLCTKEKSAAVASCNACFTKNSSGMIRKGLPTISFISIISDVKDKYFAVHRYHLSFFFFIL